MALKGKKHSDEHKEKNRLAKLGTKHSDVTRKKMSDSHKGEKHWNFGGGQVNTGRTHFKKGIIPWNKGTKGEMPVPHNKGKDSKKSYECPVCFTRFKAYLKRKYCSVKCSASQKTGENHPNWIGGGWLTVRKVVLLEQDYTCQSCGYREPDIMEVNHKLERSKYPELSRDRNNLEVLCPNCHRRKTNLFLRKQKLT